MSLLRLSVTGCTRYLVASKHEAPRCISTIALLDRQGRFMSQTSDRRVLQLRTGGNPIHRMEFCIVKKCVLLVAQNLYSVIGLFAVNRKKIAVIHLIREILPKKDDLIRALESLPDSKLILGIYYYRHRILKITLSS